MGAGFEEKEQYYVRHVLYASFQNAVQTECTISSIQVILGLQGSQVHHSNIFILGLKASLLSY